MGKIYSIETYLSDEDALDIRIEVEKGEVLNFSINYRILVNNEWCQVYRIDTAHGYLHEQRYWIGTEPISLKSKEGRFTTRKELFSHCLDEIKQSHELYRKLYLNKLGIR
ncbi:MAG: hypothetical protein AABX69_02455 [Nanoarchaeota archaeon]